MTDPQLLVSAPFLRLGLACAAEHPIAQDVLCKRLSGHLGTHQSDGGDDWSSNEEAEQ